VPKYIAIIIVLFFATGFSISAAAQDEDQNTPTNIERLSSIEINDRAVRYMERRNLAAERADLRSENARASHDGEVLVADLP
jgi:hypothetical protein